MMLLVAHAVGALVGPAPTMTSLPHPLRSTPPLLNLADDTVLLSSLEVEVLSEDEMEVLSAAAVYQHGSVDGMQGGGSLAKAMDDSLANAYGDTLNFFESLLDERREEQNQESALDESIDEKLATLRQLQSELERVLSDGLMSSKRQRWLADKADLVARQMECKEGWQALKVRQERAMMAWGELSSKAAAAHPAAEEPSSTALVVAEEWTLSQILSKTSLKEQVALVKEHAELSRKQVHLDAEDERLMVEALQLYQEERVDRERREQIVQQQEAILNELERLIEDKSAFAGHATFGGDGGFAEGKLY